VVTTPTDIAPEEQVAHKTGRMRARPSWAGPFAPARRNQARSRSFGGALELDRGRCNSPPPRCGSAPTGCQGSIAHGTTRNGSMIERAIRVPVTRSGGGRERARTVITAKPRSGRTGRPARLITRFQTEGADGMVDAVPSGGSQLDRDAAPGSTPGAVSRSAGKPPQSRGTSRCALA
jgi:hypothetical protein